MDKLSFYLYLQKKLLDCRDSEYCFDPKEATIKILKLRIPRVMIPILLKELQNLGMVERVNRYKFKIINYQYCRKLDKLNKVYHNVGLW